MNLLKKVNNKSALIGVIGLGYVGLPLALEFASKGFSVIGFDIDKKKIPILNSGKTYIKHINEDKLKKVISSKKFEATENFKRLGETDAIIICVPTPLDEHKQPDMSYVENTVNEIAKHIHRGQFVCLESTTYPGTTEELLLPILEKGKGSQIKKLKVGKDFYLAYSPEREDPNNPDYSTADIPKVVSGVTKNCLELAEALYKNVVEKTVPVSSTKTAEAAKLLENIYRSVNIALVNELKIVFERMGINIWEVIEAASTKPFGFQPFYPGPGLGGHCIPIDPFYLTWKAREYEIHTRFIELAGEINTNMPYYIVEKTSEALNKKNRSLKNSSILILGAAYKKNVDDMRESPSLRLIELLRERGAIVDYNDPFVPKLPSTRKYKLNMRSVSLTKENLKKYDLLLLSTDHDNYDYKLIAQNGKLIVDTRNAFEKRGIFSTNIMKA